MAQDEQRRIFTYTHAGSPALERAIGLGADATGRLVNNAVQRNRVRWVVNQAQITERVLDLFALIKTGAADQFVFDVAPHKNLFQGAALGVGAIHHGEVAQGQFTIGGQQTFDLVTDIGRLFDFVVRLIDHDAVFTHPIFGMQPLFGAIPIVADHRIGDIQNGLVAAIVLL